jgi:Mg-chelatase subunit ChlD
MRFANPWGLALLSLAIPVIVLHILRPRRQALVVSSTFLFRTIERPVSSAVPWQKLRWSWLLLAQLLAVLLGSLAVANPVKLTPARLAAHTVFIIDASGSMSALDGAPDRIAAAKAEAERLRDEIPPGGVASIVIAADRPRVVLTANDDRQAFTDALKTVTAVSGRADFPGAFSLAESLETSAARIGFVLLSDGGLTQEEQKLQPPGTDYRQIGTRDLNRAITLLTVEQRGSALHVRATLKNTGGPTASPELRIDVDGETAVVQQVELKPGVLVDVEVDVPPGDRVEAFLTGDDLLVADDHAVAVAGRRPDLDVLLAGDTLFVGELLASIPGINLTVSDEASPTGDGYDIVVYNQTPLPEAVAAPFLAIAPPGGVPGVELVGVLDQPAVTLLRTEHPLLSGLDLTTVGIAAAQQVTAPLADVLVAAEGGPLLLIGNAPGVNARQFRYAYLTFALADSNLPVQLTFPLLGDRLLTELAGTAIPSTALIVGAELPVPTGVTTKLTAPNGTQRTIEAGSPPVRADVPGFWAIDIADQPTTLIGVNPPASESALAPADELIKPPTPTGSGGAVPRGQRSAVLWVIVGLLAIVLIEFLLARRSVGVSRKQWRLAVLVRGFVAAALLVALLAPVLRRSSDRTATVFVLDASDSLGPGGQADAAAWVTEAMGARAGDDLAAVVAFGAEARLDRLLEPTSDFDRPEVVVDSTASNLEAAIRLGGAVLPADARRRVIIVSDGRPTLGDAASEAAALGERGTRVDVHTVDVRTGADAAVSSIDAPSLTRIGESVAITATVEATEPGPAEVVLRRNGEEVAREQVDLVVGENRVAFTDVPAAEAGAVVRYQVVVDQGGDSRPENDTGFVAVPVDGPARVLIVEGSSGEGTGLGRALEAGGIATETISIGDLPDVQTLVTYSGVVMVNVDAFQLTGVQIETLNTVVRDLGRGLVTIGGDRSYGVGGYRGSAFEELLPVVSEILDPKRRKTVAQVLSIDVSGSMANCHCDAGENPAGRADGGVNKTDISRAAAARTVEALSASDEIGILAWNQTSKWVVDLQKLPAADVVEDGLRQLKPAGATNLGDSLTEAADALRSSKAGLRHIILFSDGFTSPDVIEAVADQAGKLYTEEGITVSVIATGEGAAPSLEDIAEQGGGRFYPGEDLQQVPQVIAEEAVIASRDFITEGSFLPEITASTPVTDALTTAPPLLGYVATTSKGTATTALRIGPDRDPLLASWQAGLGRVSSWTSDASDGWSQQWATWDGYVNFWSQVVKETFPAGDTAGAVQASLSNGRLSIRVASSEAFPDGAVGSARVAGPDGQRIEVQLERTAQGEMTAEIPAPRDGSYAVGATVEAGGETVLASSTLASESYPAEYRPGQADSALLARLSAASGGRGEIEAAQAFDDVGLVNGSRQWPLRAPLLLLAALLWPIAVLLSRLSLRGATLAGASSAVRSRGRRIRELIPSIGMDPVNTGASAPPPLAETRPADASAGSQPDTKKPQSPQPTMPRPEPVKPSTSSSGAPSSRQAGGAKQTASVNELLAKKRAKQQLGDGD